MASRPTTFMDVGPLCLTDFKVRAEAGAIFEGVSQFTAPPMVGAS